MDRIVECVPNFSEGRNREIIDAIADAIKSVEGVILLDIDPGEATNRTVYTFVGEPENVKEAAFRAIAKAKELIDMRFHKGEHPRIGAADVVPFVPVRNVTMEDCVRLARELGKRVGEELGIPVYLYEYAATADYRRSLADIREGEYEALPQKLKDPKWKPDFGPAEWNDEVARSGATVIGAREFLIAYNINLNTKDKKLAHKVAKRIREKGYKRKLPDGTKEHVPGRLKAVRAIGWYIDEYERAQISINLINYKITPLWKVFEVAKEEAENLGLRVTGSEIVGLVPLNAILEVGKYYLKKQGKCTGINEREIVHTAILSLGLNEVAKFDPEEKIIEYRIEKELQTQKLAKMKLLDFVDELASDSPAPGGGSASALAVALSSSLISMVSNISYGKKKLADKREEFERIAVEAQEIKDRAIKLIDEDTRAFNMLMSAFKFKGDEEEKRKMVRNAVLRAINVPKEVLSLAKKSVKLADELEKIGLRSAMSDVGCSALLAYAGGLGAGLNVLINLSGLEDEELKNKILKEYEEAIKEIEEMYREVYARVVKGIREDLSL